MEIKIVHNEKADLEAKSLEREFAEPYLTEILDNGLSLESSMEITENLVNSEIRIHDVSIPGAQALVRICSREEAAKGNSVMADYLFNIGACLNKIDEVEDKILNYAAFSDEELILREHFQNLWRIEDKMERSFSERFTSSEWNGYAKDSEIELLKQFESRLDRTSSIKIAAMEIFKPGTLKIEVQKNQSEIDKLVIEVRELKKEVYEKKVEELKENLAKAQEEYAQIARN